MAGTRITTKDLDILLPHVAKALGIPHGDAQGRVLALVKGDINPVWQLMIVTPRKNRDTIIVYRKDSYDWHTTLSLSGEWRTTRDMYHYMKGIIIAGEARMKLEQLTARERVKLEVSDSERVTS